MNILNDDRKKSLRIFFRRYGDKLIGVLILAAVIAIGCIGYRETHPKPVSMEEMLGIDKLGLSYDVRVDGFDGESFVYSIYFDRSVTDRDIEETDMRLLALSQQNSEEEYHGYISPAYPGGDNMLYFMLDLGNADDDEFIGAILSTLDGMEGISEVVINEGVDEYD